jgi:MFS family permease
MGERVIRHEKVMINGKEKRRLLITFLTGPLIAIISVNVLRAGIFRVMNTFTSFIFEKRFFAEQFDSALIMSLILGLGGISALISGFVSSRIGSLKTYIVSMIATSIASVAVITFIGVIDLRGIDLLNSSYKNVFLAGAIILFVILSMSFYFANPSANAILAELIPLEVLSTVFGVITAIQIGFSSLVPVIFGAVVDQHYSFPYEYLILFILAFGPLLLLLYAKTKIGFKTPEQVELERAANLKQNSQKKLVDNTGN